MKRSYSSALITGASLGLGRAFARECAARGMRLMLVALPGSGLPAVGAEISRAYGVPVDWLEADLTESATLDAIARLIEARHIQIDLLVNNAGIGSIGLFMEPPLDHQVSTIDVNITALVRLTRFAVAHFGARSGCQIVNVASLGSFFPMPTLAIYSATKSFVRDFSLALRAELDGSVGVSVLCPNAIRTTDAVGEYVDQFGFACRLACLTPERIARDALDGASRNKAIIVPGLLNRGLVALSHIVPRSLVVKTIKHYWGSFGKQTACAENAVGEPQQA